MTRPFPPRLHVILAREAKVGVIIRRGPSKQTRLILWKTLKDDFVPGQWLKARVYERRSDLSPDGKHLIYFALDGHWDSPTHGSYTAISRPPYFSALGFWPKGDAWQGGGLFVDNRAVWVNGGHWPPLIEPLELAPSHLCPYPVEGNAECLGVYFPRLRRDGWHEMGRSETAKRTTVTWKKHAQRPHALRLIKHAISTSSNDRPAGAGCYYDQHEVQLGADGPTIPLPEAEWADFDHRGRLVYAAGGKLWRALAAGGELRHQEIADFTDMTFKAIPPPLLRGIG